MCLIDFDGQERVAMDRSNPPSSQPPNDAHKAARLESLAPGEPTARYHARSHARPRILVMANDPQALSLLVDEIQSLGLAPFPAADSLAALNAIDVLPPDVILMTLESPDAAVYQTVLRFAVLKRAKRAQIPLVAIVGQGGESWHRTWDHRLDGVLYHPIRAEVLYATLGRWLNLPPPAGLAPDASLPPRWRRACVEVDIQEYERALARHDAIHMAHFAHRAKGAALALRASRAAALADRLERAARGHAPLSSESIRRTLAALKTAIARYFDHEGTSREG